MPDTLIATASGLAGVRPQLDDAGNITGMTVDINLSYASPDGGPSIGRMVSIDAWALFTPQQKANMQDIQNAITQHVSAKFVVASIGVEPVAADANP